MTQYLDKIRVSFWITALYDLYYTPLEELEIRSETNGTFL